MQDEVLFSIVLFFFLYFLMLQKGLDDFNALRLSAVLERNLAGGDLMER